jgi:hypothetical protein
MDTMFDSAAHRRIELRYPLLNRDSYGITSPASSDYNCVAWAIHDTQAKWWPLPVEEAQGYFWPEGARRDDSLEAFVDGLRRLAPPFEVCPDAAVEPGFEKIAIFAKSNGSPQHVARQLADGRWASKLGDGEDIEHNDLQGVAGGFYGYPVVFMRRRLV